MKSYFKHGVKKVTSILLAGVMTLSAIPGSSITTHASSQDDSSYSTSEEIVSESTIEVTDDSTSETTITSDSSQGTTVEIGSENSEITTDTTSETTDISESETETSDNTEDTQDNSEESESTTGYAYIEATTDDGMNLSGVIYEVYSDSECTDEIGSYVLSYDGNAYVSLSDSEESDELSDSVYYDNESLEADIHASIKYLELEVGTIYYAHMDETLYDSTDTVDTKGIVYNDSITSFSITSSNVTKDTAYAIKVKVEASEKTNSSESNSTENEESSDDDSEPEPESETASATSTDETTTDETENDVIYVEAVSESESLVSAEPVVIAAGTLGSLKSTTDSSETSEGTEDNETEVSTATMTDGEENTVITDGTLVNSTESIDSEEASSDEEILEDTETTGTLTSDDTATSTDAESDIVTAEATSVSISLLSTASLFASSTSITIYREGSSYKNLVYNTSWGVGRYYTSTMIVYCGCHDFSSPFTKSKTYTLSTSTTYAAGYYYEYTYNDTVRKLVAYAVEENKTDNKQRAAISLAISNTLAGTTDPIHTSITYSSGKEHIWNDAKTAYLDNEYISAAKSQYSDGLPSISESKIKVHSVKNSDGTVGNDKSSISLSSKDSKSTITLNTKDSNGDHETASVNEFAKDIVLVSDYSDNYITFELPSHVYAKLSDWEFWRAPGTTITLKAGERISFAMDSSYAGDKTITASGLTGCDAYYVPALYSSSYGTYLQPLYWGYVSKSTITINLSTTASDNEVSVFRIQKNSKDDVDNDEMNSINGHYNFAGLRYGVYYDKAVTDSEGKVTGYVKTLIKSKDPSKQHGISVDGFSVFVLSYDGKAYLDMDGNNVIFACKEAKQKYLDENDDKVYKITYKYDVDGVLRYYKELSTLFDSTGTGGNTCNAYWYDASTYASFISSRDGASVSVTGHAYDSNYYEIEDSDDEDTAINKVEEAEDQEYYGYLYINKIITNSDIDYSELKGLSFTVYKVTTNNNTSSISPVATFTHTGAGANTYTVKVLDNEIYQNTVSSGGTNNGIKCQLGYYYIVENETISKSLGFDQTVSLTVSSNGTTYSNISASNPFDITANVSATFNFTNTRTRLSLYKYADASNLNSNYTLAGATFEVYYYNENDAGGTDKIVLATFKTDANGNGIVQTVNSSENIYKVDNYTIGGVPVGETIYATETSCPTGWILSSDKNVEFDEDNMTQTFTFTEYHKYGKLSLWKVNEIDQGSYDLSDAEYTVYSEEEGANVAKFTIVKGTDSSGNVAYIGVPSLLNGYGEDEGFVLHTSTTLTTAANYLELPIGTYKITETTTADGFRTDEYYYKAVVTDNTSNKTDVTAVYQTLYTYEVDGDTLVNTTSYTDAKKITIKSTDPFKRGGFAIQKNDYELDTNYAQGDATLKGALYYVYNMSTNAVYVNGTVYEPGAVCFEFTTDEEGRYISDSNLLPYGTYKIVEIEAPEGYLLDGGVSEQTFTISKDRQYYVYGDDDLYAKVKEKFELKDDYIEQINLEPFSDIVKRGGFHIEKAGVLTLSAIPGSSLTTYASSVSEETTSTEVTVDSSSETIVVGDTESSDTTTVISSSEDETNSDDSEITDSEISSEETEEVTSELSEDTEVSTGYASIEVTTDTEDSETTDLSGIVYDVYSDDECTESVGSFALSYDGKAYVSLPDTEESDSLVSAEPVVITACTLGSLNQKIESI